MGQSTDAMTNLSYLLRRRFSRRSPGERRSGFTIVEMIVASAIVAMLMGYAWKFFFSGREITRHTVSQSQMQSDMRIFLDKLAREISACYSFHEVDPAAKKFSFFSFRYARTVLEELYYDESARKKLAPINQKLRVLRIEYEHKDNGDVARTQKVGDLFFLRKPMEFQEVTVSGAVDADDKSFSSVELKNIQTFAFKGYRQEFQRNNAAEPVKITPITAPDKASGTTFLTLQIHALKDEKASNRRDEELDIVCKLYSRVKLAEAAYPDYFSSVDTNSRF